jgi:hypothetical protein
MSTASVNGDICHFHRNLRMRLSIRHTKRSQLLLANVYSNEATRIETKIHNPTHPNKFAAKYLSSNITNELSRQ